MKQKLSTRTLPLRIAVILFSLALVPVVLAGPPLICHPFEIGNAKSLPWSGSDWNLSGNERYDTKALAQDLRRFAIQVLERHLERKLRSAEALARLGA